MNNKEKYKYDIAFSFLNEDENIVRQINNVLSKTYKTFIYFNKQNEIAGTDGEKAFNSVFGIEARTVVVLYRENWGKTPWTRIEQTAIRNRAFEEGYDFVLFIPLCKPPNVPKWLPKTQLWIGIDRFGVNGACSIIDERIKSFSGKEKVESIDEKAKRIESEILKEKKLKQFLKSFDGVQAAHKEIKNLFKSAKDILIKIRNNNKQFNFDIQENDYLLHVFCKKLTLRFIWNQTYQNSTTNSVLNICIWKGRFHRPFSDEPYLPWVKPVKLKEKKYKFNKDKNGEIGWATRINNENIKSSTVAEKIIDIYLEEIRKIETK